MNISVFEVSGPVMIGPSSSHTAGAARLARIAKLITAEPFYHVSFGLHGSFAKTYRGHGTDVALVAGVLGFYEDDECLSDAFSIAKKQGISYDFFETELDGLHENSVLMRFHLIDGGIYEVTGSSIGGAQIVIRNINGFEIEFYAMFPTLFIEQKDQKGVVSEVTKILAEGGLNIGVMKLSRTAKGDTAFCVIETDDRIQEELVAKIRGVPNVRSARAINLDSKMQESGGSEPCTTI